MIVLLEGYYLGPIGGLGWVIGASALTIIVAIGWMRSYPERGSKSDFGKMFPA